MGDQSNQTVKNVRNSNVKLTTSKNVVFLWLLPLFALAGIALAVVVGNNKAPQSPQSSQNSSSPPVNSQKTPQK